MKHVFCTAFVFLLFAGCLSAETLRIVKLETRVNLRPLFVLSPDKTKILLWDRQSRTNNIPIYDAESGKELTKLEGAEITFFAVFSPDGKRIVSINQDKTARIWDAETGKELHKLEGHTEEVRTAVFSPDGKKIITASQDKTARIWDAETGMELKKLEGHTETLFAANFAPNGKSIVSTSQDKTIRIWNAESDSADFGKEFKTFEINVASELSYPIFSHDSKRLVIQDGGAVRIMDAKSDSTTFGKELQILKSPDGSCVVCFTPDGNRLITRGFMAQDGKHTVRIWDVESGKELHALNVFVYVYAIFFSPDGKKIIVVDILHRVIRILDTESGKELQEWTLPPVLTYTSRLNTHVLAADFSPDGKKMILVVSDGLGIVRIFEYSDLGLYDAILSQNLRRNLLKTQRIF